MTAAKRTRAKAPKPSKDDLRLDRQLCFPLYVAARLIVSAYRPLLGPLGLTYPQYLVMLALWEEDGLSVGALGERLHLDSGTLTPLLKRMERQELVKRSRSSADDRVVLIHLSEAGRALERKAITVPTGLLCQTHMTMDDVLSTKGALDKLIQELLPLTQHAGEPELDD